MIPNIPVLVVVVLNPKTSVTGQHIFGVLTSNPQADSLKIKIITFENPPKNLRRAVPYICQVWIPSPLK